MLIGNGFLYKCITIVFKQIISLKQIYGIIVVLYLWLYEAILIVFLSHFWKEM